MFCSLSYFVSYLKPIFVYVYWLVYYLHSFVNKFELVLRVYEYVLLLMLLVHLLLLSSCPLLKGCLTENALIIIELYVVDTFNTGVSFLLFFIIYLLVYSKDYLHFCSIVVFEWFGQTRKLIFKISRGTLPRCDIITFDQTILSNIEMEEHAQNKIATALSNTRCK